MNRIPTITIKGTEVCELGKGSYGKVCEYKSTKGKSFAVKEILNPTKHTRKEMKKEMKLVFNFYYSLPTYYKRYFVKPYYVKLENSNKKEEFSYALDIVPNRQSAYNYLHDLYNTNKTKKLKLIIRRIRHAIYAMWKHDLVHFDLHLENILINTKTNMPKIIDFGRSKKVKRTAQINSLKTAGTKKLNELDDQLKDWFLKEMRHQPEINPNAVFFPNIIQRNQYYAKRHYNNIELYLNKIK